MRKAPQQGLRWNHATRKGHAARVSDGSQDQSWPPPATSSIPGHGQSIRRAIQQSESSRRAVCDVDGNAQLCRPEDGIGNKPSPYQSGNGQYGPALNGRDWHHLIDLCALTETLVIDPEGVYDPKQMNDRLLLGLKGTMSEYELSLLRQRGLAARDAKAARGALRFTLPPGFIWTEDGQIEMDPDERVREAVGLVLRKFVELGSGRQVFLWLRTEEVSLPVVKRNSSVCRLVWKPPTYHAVMQILKSPIYAGAYAFGRTTSATRLEEGRAVKTSGHSKPQEDWNVLIRDHHAGYIDWSRFEENQKMLLENAHMKKRASRKSGRGGKALLTGMVRCGRCGRMMRTFYGSAKQRPYRYQCRGDDGHVGAGLCIGIGGLAIDKALACQILEAVSPRAIEAALLAAERTKQAGKEQRQLVAAELEEAQYQASLAERRYEHVDPEKRHVARELENRWNAALQRVADIEAKLAKLEADKCTGPSINPEALLRLADDLPRVWNSPRTDTAAKQRLARLLIEEVIIDLDDERWEAVVTTHWIGGRHTEERIPRRRVRARDAEPLPNASEVMRRLGGQYPDRELAVTLNRMKCRTADDETWTTVKVTALRTRLGIPEYDPDSEDVISADQAAHRLGICITSVHKLIKTGALPAKQPMRYAPWKIPVEALETESVRIGLQGIAARRPRRSTENIEENSLRLPGI